MSESCRDAGECFYNPEERRCDDDTEPADTALFASGLAVVGVGLLSVAAGALTFVVGGLNGLGCRAGAPCSADDTTVVGSVLMGVGGVLALCVGLPMAVQGGIRVPRHRGRVGLHVESGTGNTALTVTF